MFLPLLSRRIIFSLQWGSNFKITRNGYGVDLVYPIAFLNETLAIIPFDINGDWGDTAIPNIHAAWYPNDGSGKNNLQGAKLGFSQNNNVFGSYGFVAIGK